MASNQNVNKVVYAGTTLIDLTGDDVTAASVLSGKKFHLPSGAAATGTIPSQAAQTITPGTSNKTIAAGKYLSGAQTIAGSSNLVASKIKSGVSIFGVTGSYKGELPATVTSVATPTWNQGTINTGGDFKSSTTTIRTNPTQFSGDAVMIQAPAGYQIAGRVYTSSDAYVGYILFAEKILIFELTPGRIYRFLLQKTDESTISPSTAPTVTFKQITWG